MPFAEHTRRVIKYAKSAPRPAWMAESVVDPAWVEQQEKKRHLATRIPDPFVYMGNLETEHVKNMCGLPVPDGDAAVKLDEALDELMDAAADAANTAIEIAVKDKAPHTLTGDVLTAALAKDLKVFKRALSDAIQEALSDANRDMDEDAILNGFWEKLRDDGHLDPQELIAEGVSRMDQIDLQELVDDWRRCGVVK